MMRDFEHDNLNPQNESPENERDPFVEENKPSEEELVTPPAQEEPVKEEKKEEPFRDIYGNTHYSHYEPPKPPKKKTSEVKMSGGALAMLLVCCMLMSILVGAGINYVFDHGADAVGTSATGTTVNGTTAITTPNETTNGTAGENPTETTENKTAPAIGYGGGGTGIESSEHEVYAAVTNKCIQSVVVIRVTENKISYGQEYLASGAGSGVIFDANGYIVTNYHVVGEKTKTISVELYDGSIYEGTYIYGDEYADLSVIKIDKTDCVAAKIGDSSKMALGQMVVAIGNPLGYGLAVTPGVVSAFERSITVENITMKLMQTSAAINSGNSGGGLFNLQGELIGIVNAKIGGTNVEGMGFAIPTTDVVKVLNDLNTYGYITGKARLGVTTQSKQYQTWPYMQTYTFTQISEINPNGSAAKSGLQVGDIFYKLNGKEITSYEALAQQLTKYAVGDTVTLTVLRPTVELNSNNLSEYLNTAKEVELQITFVEFDPNS